MAKNVAHVNAIIDLAVKGTKQAQKQLEQIGEIKDKIEKDGRFQYVVEVDDQQMMKLKEVKDKLDLRNENLMQIGIDEKSFSGSKEAVQEFVSWIKTTLESVRIGDIIGSGGTGDSAIQKEIDAQKKKLGELQKVLGEQKKIYEEQGKIIEDANKKMANAEKVDISKYAKDVVSKYSKVDKLYSNEKSTDKEIDTALFELEESFRSFIAHTNKFQDLAKIINKLPGENKEDRMDSYDDLLNYFKEYAFDGDTKGRKDFESKIKTIKGFESLHKEYKEDSFNDGDNELVNSLKQTIESAVNIQNHAETRIKELELQISGLQTEIKTLEDNAKKSANRGGVGASGGGSGKSGVKVSEEVKEEIEKGGTAKVNVKPSNLDGFYKEIEDYKTANIKVTLDNSAITKKNKNANVDTLNIATKLDATKSLSTLRTDIQNAINPIEITLDDKNIGNLGSIVDKVKNEISTDNAFHNQIDSLVEGLKGKYKTEENILSQIRGIINTAKGSKGGKLTQDQKSQLVALSKIYEDKTGKNFSSVLKEIGIRQNAKYLDGVKKDVDEYQNYLKEQAVTVPVDLELNKTSLEKLENQVKNSLSNVEITLDISKAKNSISELKAEWKSVEPKKEVIKKDDPVKAKDDSNVTVTKRVMPIKDQYKNNLKAEIEKHIKQYTNTDELDLFGKISKILKDASDSGKELNRMQAAELVALDAVYQKRANKDSAVQDIVKLQKLDSDKLLSNYEALNKLWSKAPNKNLLKAIEPSGEAKKKEKENPKKPEEPKKVPVEIVINNEDKIVSTLKTKVNEINPIDLEFNLTNLEKLKTDVQNIFDNVDISINAAAGQSVSDKKTPITIKTSSKTVGAATKAEQGLYKTFDTIWSEYAIKTEYDVYDKIAAIFRGTLKKKDPQLSSKDAAKVASLKELYKLMSGKSSPVADILKGLGIKDFDTVLKKNYSAAESAFEKWSVERSPKKDKTANSGISQKPKESKGGNNVETTVAFKPDKKSLGDLKTNIQKSINPVDLTFTSNIKNIKADIMSAIGNIDINVDPKLSSGNASSVGNIVKQIAEADSLMKDKGSARFERSLFFNTKTGYVGNPFVHGKKNTIPSDLLDAQRGTLTESVNALLHTHPADSTTPSSGDLKVYARELKNGITQQFIATMKKVLHFNFENVKQKDLSDISDKYAKKIAEIRSVDDNYQIKNRDVNVAFNTLQEHNAKQLKESFTNILKNQKGFNSKDLDGVAESFYLNFKNALSSNFLKNKDGLFNTDDFINANLDKIFTDKNLLKNNKDSLTIGLKGYIDSLLGNVKKPVDKNMVKEVNEYLRTLFKNKGYNPDDIMKTYSIDEFEKMFGTQIKETGQSSEVGQLNLLKGAVEDVEAAVESKTDSFITEAETIERVVDDEIGHLGRLIEKLKEVQDNAHISLNVNKDQADITSQENPHIVTDPQGNEITVYRGIRDTYGGTVSNRYHGGTFSTDSLDLARLYASLDGKIEKSKISMKNPFEFDAKGSRWNELEYIGDGSDEASKKIIELKNEIFKLKNAIDTLKDSGFEIPEDTILKYQQSLNEQERELAEIYNDKSNPYGMYDTNKMVEYAKSLGHDGVIFKNVYDGLDVPNNLFVTFKEEQIHYIETIKTTFEDAINYIKRAYSVDEEGLSKYSKIYLDRHKDPNLENEFLSETNDKIVDYLSAVDKGDENYLKWLLHRNPALKNAVDVATMNESLDPSNSEDILKVMMDSYRAARYSLLDVQEKFNTSATSIEEYEAEQAALKPTIEDKSKGDDIPVDVILNPDVENLRTQLSTITPPPVVNVDLDPNIEKLKTDLQSVKGLVANVTANPIDSAVEGETAETKTSITSLVESIKGIGDTFVKQTTRIGNTSKTQIKHINSVREAVQELNEAISKPETADFMKSIDLGAELEQIHKERKELKKQQDEFNKQKEESEPKETDSKEEKKSSKKDKKKDDSAAKQKAEKTAKDIINSYNDAINDLDLDDKGNPNNLILNKVVDENDTTLKSKIEELKTTGNSLKQAIETGGLSDDHLKEKTESLKNIVEQLKTLNTIENQIVAKGGEIVDTLALPTSLFNSNKKEIEQDIKRQLEGQYERVLSDPKYKQFADPKKGQITAKVLDNGQIKKVTYTLEEYGKVAGKTAVQVRELVNVEGKYVTQSGKWFAGFKSKLSNLTQYVTGIELVMKAWNEAREGFEFVKELNANMTTIYQTMDITREELDKLSSGAIKASKDLGALNTQMLDSINIYAAYGKTYQQILEQAKPTVMLANASGASAEEASDYIQAVIQQYKELEGQETRIVNSYEKIAANVQIDFDKGIRSISEGVQTAGSVMNEAGVDFETYASSVAKVAERTRLEGSQIGNAMKTIASRISRSKSGDEDVTAEDRSNASKAYRSVGIDVYNEDGSYRGLATILDELAAKWDTLTDAQKNYVAEQSAGVRNINIFNTMLDTWGEANQLAADANEDTDYYMEVQEKWMESMTAKINTLKSSMQEFWYNLIDTGAVNLVIDALTKIVEGADLVVKAFKEVGNFFGGEIGGAVGGVGAVAAMVATIASAWDSFNKKLTTDLGDGMTITKRGGFTQIGKDFVTFGKTAIESAGKFKTAWADAGYSLNSIPKVLETIGVKNVSLVSGLLKFGAVAAAIGLAVFAFDQLSDSTEETKNAVEKLNSAYEQNKQILSNNKKTIDSIGEEFETLSKGVNANTGENLSLTNDEYARYQEITSQIADMYPELVKSYDAQGNAILNLKGNLEELNEAYEQQRLNAAKEALYGEEGKDDNLATYLENFKNLNGQRSWLTKAWDSFWDVGGLFGVSEIDGDITAGEVIDGLEEIQEMTYAEVKEWIKKQKANKNDDLLDWMSSSNNLGLDVGYNTTRDYSTGEATTNLSITEENWQEAAKKIQGLINEISPDVESATNSLKQGLQEYLTVLELEDADFAGIDSSVFKQMSNFISTMTTDQIKTLTARGVDLETYIKNLTTKLSNSAEAQVSLENILNLGDDATIEEMRRVLEEDLVTLASELDIAEEDLPKLKVQLGLDDDEEFLEAYDSAVDSISRKIGRKQLTKNLKGSVTQAKKLGSSIEDAGDEADLLKDYSQEIKDYIKEQGINTEDELVLLERCVEETDSWAAAIRKFELNNVATDFEEIIETLKGNLASVETTVGNINDAMSGSNASIGLTAEQIKNVVAAFEGLEDVDGNKIFDYDKLFESTASGVRLNAYELDRLNREYDKAQKAKYADTLDDMQKEYEELCVAITEAKDDQEKLNLIAKRNNLKDQIEQVQELTSRYGGLSSAYEKWKNAQETTNSYEMYDDIYSGIAEIDELYQRDLTGSDDFKNYMKQFFYGDLDEYLNNANKSYQQFYEENAAMIQQYFTEDNTGSVNFLNKLQELGYAWQNELGQWEIDGEIEDIAKSFGWATSTIDAQFKKLEAHEFKFQFIETKPLDELKGKAEETVEFVKTKFGKELDFGTNNIDTIDKYVSELKDLKGQSGRTAEEVEALNTQIDYWTARKGELTKAVEFEFSLDATVAELELCQDKLKELGKISSDFNLNPSSIAEVNVEISKAKKVLEDFVTSDGQIDITQEGAEEVLAILANLMKTKMECSNPVIMTVDTSKVTGEAGVAIDALQEYQDALNSLEAIETINSEMGVNIDTTEAQAQVDAALEKLKTVDKDILAKFKIDPSSTDTLKKDIAAITPEMMVKAGVNQEAILGYTPEDKNATVTYDIARTAEYDAFLNKNLNRTATITYTYVTSGSIPSSSAVGGVHKLNGTAHVSGTAYAGGTGNWGAEKDEVALVGEVAPELRVNSKTGRWELLGKNGAEFAKINKNDIIFNGRQTEELFKNGKVTSGGGRGRAFINGTISKLNSLFKVGSGNAYAYGGHGALTLLGGNSGRYTTSGLGIKNNATLNQYPTNNQSLITNNNISDANEKAEEFLETIDWVEIMIDRLERKIQDLDTIANSAYKNFSKRNKTLAEEFGKVTDEITLQQQAYNTYMAKANSIALSETYKQKVRDGKLQIEDITDENLKEKIDEFQEWYEKALDCKYAITDLNEQLGDLAKTKFDNVQTEFDEIIAKIEDSIEMVEGGLDIVEAKGQFASRQYFETLMSIEKENIAMIEKEYADLQGAYNEAMSTGAISEGSEAWYEMQQQIRDVEKSLQDANLALIEYKNDMWDMDWSAFEYGMELIEQLTSESEFLVNLLSLNENDLFSKVSGKLTDSGFSVAGLHAMDYNVYMAQAEEYEKKMKEVNAELAKDPTNKILIDKKNEYLEAQREAISNANDEKMAIRDLIEESYNRMLEILQELIDKRKEALQAEKDLYSYEKNVAEQTKQIADYQKQLSALAGDDSEESKSKRQQLQESLRQAESDLEETEYDQWLSDQEKLMDKMYEDYETILNERLDNIDGLLMDMINHTNENADMINTTITSAADKVGYGLTEDMTSIWNTTDSGIGKVVSDFNTNFTTTLTTTNEYIKKVYNLINKNVKNADKDMTANTKPGADIKPSSTGSSSSSGSTSKPTTNTNTSGAGQNKGWFFVYKKDSFPKNQLNTERSIVDRLKYHNFDSSWSNMAMYYEKMGLGSRSSYVGSYQQNVNMLNWMKKNGFRHSGQLSSMISTAREDGLFLGRKDDTILAKEDWLIASAMVEKLIDFSKLQPNTGAIKGMTYTDSSENNFTMNFNLPNISNGQEFVDFLKTKKAQNIIQSYTTDAALGKNSLSKYKYK